jgi:hypothetical protein
MLYQSEDVAEAFIGLVRRPRDEVAVGWPARAGQASYGLARGPTERLLGQYSAFFFRAPARGEDDGHHRRASPIGTATSGGWLARKGIPPARDITRLAVGAGVLALGLTMIVRLARARSGRRDRDSGLTASARWNGRP